MPSMRRVPILILVFLCFPGCGGEPFFPGPATDVTGRWEGEFTLVVETEEGPEEADVPFLLVLEQREDRFGRAEITGDVIINDAKGTVFNTRLVGFEFEFQFTLGGIPGSGGGATLAFEGTVDSNVRMEGTYRFVGPMQGGGDWFANRVAPKS